MEDQSLFTTCIQKHIAHQTTKIKKKKGGGEEKKGVKENVRDTLLETKHVVYTE